MASITLTCPTDIPRLDKFLAEAVPDLSRQQAKTMIKQGLVEAKGLNLKPSLALPEGTTLTLILPDPAPANLEAYEFPLSILHEDEAMIVVDKPAGLVVHPALGHAQDTLVNALLNRYPLLAQMDQERAGVVHRLDKDTSGVIVVARTKEALLNLQAQFEARRVGKTYLALVHGHPQSSEGIIDVPIARHPQHRQQMAAHPRGKPAQTHYQVTQNFDHYSLLTLAIKTGRTHQIRVHLSWLGYPVVGDSIYGRRKTPPSLSRQFLHAHRLELNHPHTGQGLQFESPLPSDLQKFLTTIT